MKVVLNKCYGGFSLNNDVVTILLENDSKLDCDMIAYNYNDRFNKDLIAVIEKYGSEFCSGYVADLRVIEIPDDITDYKIIENDGYENIFYVVNGALFEK